MKSFTLTSTRCAIILFAALFTSFSFSQVADFNVQHIQDDIPNTGGSTAISPVTSLSNAFALANNNRKVNAGLSGSSANLPADDLSGARALTATGTLSYYRQGTSNASNMRFNSSVWDYIGPVGGVNEMVVRNRYVVTLNGGTNNTTVNIAAAGVVDANKCIPFITGILTNRGSAGADSGTAVAYLENATTLRVQKGTNANNVTVYVTLVEFTGSNWTVLHGDSGNTAGDTGGITLRSNANGTGTATNVSSWDEAIIFSHHRGDNNANGVNMAIEDNWPIMDPGGNNQTVDWTFSAGHLSNGTNRQFVHVLNNPDLSVTRFQNTSNTADETTINIASAGLTNLNEALIIGSSISNGGGTAYGRGWRNYYFNSTTEAAHWSHRSGNTMNHEIQIVDLSNLTTAGYCPAVAGSDSFEYIGNVTLNSIDNTSGQGSTSTGYSDFTAISTDLMQGVSYPISISPEWPGTVYTEGVAVWIDYNNNLTFDPTELVFTAGPDSTSPQLGSITVPATATLGPTRMRVIMDDNIIPTGPCANPNFGEVEDYTINIVTSTPFREINITGNSNNIGDNDVLTFASNNTNFGNVDIAGGTNPNTFIIENLGVGLDLNLLGASPYVVIGGTHAADFTLTAIPANTIPGGGTTAFEITFNPSAIGLRTATVSILNDDALESPYNFNIQGTGFVPPPCGSAVIHTADFESGLDGWTSGGVDAERVNNAIWSYGGNYSLRVRDDDAVGTASSFNSPAFDLSTYDKVDFKFFFAPDSVEDIEEFMIEYSNDDGATWTTVQVFEGGSVVAKTADFETSTTAIFYSKTVTVKNADYAFPASATSRFRVRCNASEDDDEVYLDNIRITGTSYCNPTEGPGGVTSSLDLWLKADMINGINEATDTSPVNQWVDNGRGNDAEAVVSGLAPTYRDHPSRNFNFNPVIDFTNNNNTANRDMTYMINDGSRNELTGTGGFSSNDMFIVIMPDPTITTTMIPLDTFTSTDPTFYDIQAEDVTGFGYGGYTGRVDNERLTYCIGVTSETTPTSPEDGYARADTASPTNYNQIGILNFRANAALTDMELYLNANQVGNESNSLVDFAISTDQRFWLGRSQYWNGSFDGRIAEVITYSATNNDGDSTQERNRIQSYLGIKYGITLGVNGISQDYVNSDGDIIWNQLDNLGFNYDIAGIGRDDVSELNQKQSSSVNNATDIEGPIEGVITVGLSDIYATNKENKDSNPITLGDKEYLVWGNNNADLNLDPTEQIVNMSSGITAPPLVTEVSFRSIERVWKFVETGGDVPTVKLSIPSSAIRNISPPGNYYMFISDTGVFDPTADYRVMTPDLFGNLVTEYDFDGTKFITFGYAEQVIVERSVYFDGAVDYIDVENKLNLDPTGFTLSAWIKRDAADNGTASIISKRDVAFTQGYDFTILDDNRIEIIWKNGTDQVLRSNTSLPDDEWHHIAAIYNGSEVALYIDGVLDDLEAKSAPVDTNESFYIAAAGKNAPTQFFRGNIDEVRVWDRALSADQLRFVMNQEIADNAGQVMGSVLPTAITKNDIDAIDWDDLAAYYPMSVYTYTNTDDASGKGNQGALRNLNTVDRQTAPLPYVSSQDGDWDLNTTWTNGDVQYVPGSASIVDPTTTVNWNIIRTAHEVTMDNTTLPAASFDNREVLGLYVDASELTLNGDNLTNTGNAITVSHYLSLTGKLDLEGESQLIQPIDSDLDVAVTGSLERDQQGTADTYTYNYWSAPVGETDIAKNDYRYTLEDIMLDGTTPINFTPVGFDGSAGTPITIADYWVWKFANQTGGDYSSWQHVRRTGTLNAGEGFTMKGPGTGPISADQNYVFLGKPNNGNINLSITAGNNYLIGNPYASALDANQFIIDNGPTLFFDGTQSISGGSLEPILDGSGNPVLDGDGNDTFTILDSSGNPVLDIVGDPVVAILDGSGVPVLDGDGNPSYLILAEDNAAISGTLYFWEHWGGGSHVLAEYQGGYATYNFSGAVAAASLGTNDADVATGGTPTKIPGRYIPVSQGFFVSGQSNGTLNFNNGQRVFEKEGTANSIFVRPDRDRASTSNAIAQRTEETDDRMKFRIGFNSINTIHRQLLLTIDENTTPAVDWAYDAPLNEVQIDDMFWIINDYEYVIQASNEAEESSIYPIGIKTDSDGVNSITIDALENVPDSINIFIHDTELNTYHNLRDSDFEIFLNAGEYLNRFEVTFSENTNILGLDDEIENSINILYASDIEKIVLINPNLIDIESIELFNILGQAVKTIENISESGYSEYEVKNLSTGTYIIKLITVSGSVVTKKVLVK